MSEHLTTLLLKLETISSAYTDWRDSEEKCGYEVLASCDVDRATADRICDDILSVRHYCRHNPWNHTTMQNLLAVWENVHTNNTLDAFALHTFMEALDDFCLEHQEWPKLEHQDEWEAVNTRLRKLIRDTQEGLVRR